MPPDEAGAAAAAAQGTPAPIAPPPELPLAPADAAASAGAAPAAVEPGLPQAAAAGATLENEFQPSLLDEAVAKAAEPPAKPAGDQPAEPAKEPAKPEGEAAKDSPGQAPLEPIKYEFTYPEGVKPEDLNSERMTAYTDILGGARIAPEVGQKLLDLHLAEIAKATNAYVQEQWDVFRETQTKWRNEVKADPELGGSRHETAIREIMSLVDHYGGNAEERKGLMDALRITGAGNNLHILRFLRRAGASLAREATPHPAPPPRAPQLTGRERSLARYGRTGAPNGAA